MSSKLQCRLTAEIMMEEIGRRPGGGGAGEFGSTSTQGSAVSQDREGYALAAGLALGLITLGRAGLLWGSVTCTLSSDSGEIVLS